MRFTRNLSWLTLLATTLLVLAAPGAATAQSAPTGLRVRVTPPAAGVRPGSVVRIDVRSVNPLAKLDVMAFGRQFPFILSEDARAATALLGIAADTAPRTYPIQLDGHNTHGLRLVYGIDLVVTRPLFRSQRLRVDPRFVQPPAEVMPRIEKERARLGELSHAIDRDRPWQAPFKKPLATPVSEPYGVRRTFNGELASQHRGVDLKGAMGAPIAAPGAGRVVLAEELYYTGNTVVIDHGYGVQSLLAHMSRLLVKEGQLVERGEIVGEVGATGRVTGPHLHWSAWVGGVSIDPLSLIAAIGR